MPKPKPNTNHSVHVPKAQMPLCSTRLDTFEFVEWVKRVETSESSRAVPTWRTTNKL